MILFKVIIIIGFLRILQVHCHSRITGCSTVDPIFGPVFIQRSRPSYKVEWDFGQAQRVLRQETRLADDNNSREEKENKGKQKRRKGKRKKKRKTGEEKEKEKREKNAVPSLNPSCASASPLIARLSIARPAVHHPSIFSDTVDLFRP